MQRYQRGHDPALDRELEAAEAFGKLRLGEKHIFACRLLHREYVAIEDVQRAWHRQEGVISHVGCCPTDFSIHRLMLLMKDGSRQELLIGDSLFRHEDEQLMQALRQRHPELPIGKPASEA